MLTGQKTNKEFIKTMRDAESYLHNLAEKIGDMADAQELPIMLADIKQVKLAGVTKEITPAFLQKKYKIGYARATRLVETLKAQK